MNSSSTSVETGHTPSSVAATLIVDEREVATTKAMRPNVWKKEVCAESNERKRMMTMTFAEIMQQEQEGRRPDMASKTAKAKDLEEEDLIQLAIEASLAAVVPFDNDVSEKQAEASQSNVAATAASSANVTAEEEEAVWRAIREADEAEDAASLNLAIMLQQHEHSNNNSNNSDANKHTTVRTVSHHEFFHHLAPHANKEQQRSLWSQRNDEEEEQEEDHYRINSSVPSKTWSKLDRNTIVGPNNQIRTKHDLQLKNQSNALRLLAGQQQKSPHQLKMAVSDSAYNSFQQSIKKQTGAIKGVAAHAHGRAENMNAQKTRGGAMDGNVRLIITRAINDTDHDHDGTSIITKCNGVIKEGKEAVIYHAEGGGSGGDVAIKVFKRIQEFKGRGVYVDGDSRYHGQKFNTVMKRKQVELWAEKEYRNLIRSTRAGVPVPTPILRRENVLFLSFLGDDDGWPCPQLRELDMKKGSPKWSVFYGQVMVAVRKLYQVARLVHGDLSEYNILICPSSQIVHMYNNDNDGDSLQVVLIDFGQAVDRHHPLAMDFLYRDLAMVRSFFVKQGIATLSNEDALQFVLKNVEKPNNWQEIVPNDDNNDEANDAVVVVAEEEEKHLLHDSDGNNEEDWETIATNEDEEEEELVDDKMTTKKKKKGRQFIPWWKDEDEFQYLEEQLSKTNMIS